MPEPEPEASVQTLEQGTDPLHIETRSHYVQTRLSSLPSPQIASGSRSTAESASAKAAASGPVILHRVIVDPSAEAASGGGGSGGGLTAILPLLKQCTRCGSQRVRLLLVERPPVSLEATPHKPTSPLPADHTQRHQHQHPHVEQHVSSHHRQSITLPRVSQMLRKSAEREHPQAHHQPIREERPRHQRPQSSSRSLTQPITYDPTLFRG